MLGRSPRRKGWQFSALSLGALFVYALSAEIGRGGFGVRLDVARQATIDAAAAEVVAKAGGIDILVNNAGIFEMAPILEITEASWDKQFAVNTKGLLFVPQAVARRMVVQGRGGKIVNVAQPGRPPRRGPSRGLPRVEGRGDQPDPEHRPRPDQAQDQRQRHRPRA